MPLIAGDVLDRNGAPVPAASVYLADGPGPVPDIALLTGSDGTFAIDAPSPGLYRLGVRAGSRVAEVEVRVAAAGTSRVRVKV